MRYRIWLHLLAISASVLAAAPVAANGRFPAANQIVVDPSDPNHIVARTTYGLLVTNDGGKAWDWICEQAVEWTGQYDPPVTLTKDGSLIAGIYDHLGAGTQGGCVWNRPVALEGKNVIDVSTQKDDSAIAVALTSNPLAGGMFLSQVWRSVDNGKAWTKLGVDLPTDFIGLTLDVAPSDPKFVVASGQIGKGGPGVLERTKDGGMTWEQRAIPGTDIDHAPYIAAIDPSNPLKVYVRLSGSPGILLISPDGGDSWSNVFAGQGTLKGFALSPDGSELLVGGETDGIHSIATATLATQKISDVRAQCLVWTDGTVYACAAEAKDGFTIGKSVDGAKTFTPLNYLACVRGPLACDAATDVGKTCPGAWPATAELLDTLSCKQGAGGSGGTGGAGGSAGEGGAGGAGGAPGVGGGSASSSASTGGSGGTTDSGGCGKCSVGSEGVPWKAPFLAVFAAVATTLARAKRRSTRHQNNKTGNHD